MRARPRPPSLATTAEEIFNLLEGDACAVGERRHNLADCPVVGVDEAGRGPLAGPVVAAAVRLPDGCRLPGLDDSKKLNANQRANLDAEIRAVAEIGVAIVNVATIERINILEATMTAMCQAVAQLADRDALILIDGNRIPRPLSAEHDAGRLTTAAVVKGDGRIAAIAAASIIAKTVRDRLMITLSDRHPGYGWETNMGYGTAVHLDALQRLGVTPEHRRGFAPVRAILEADRSRTPATNSNDGAHEGWPMRQRVG